MPIKCEGHTQEMCQGIKHYYDCYRDAVYKLTFKNGASVNYCPYCKAKILREGGDYNMPIVEKLPDELLPVKVKKPRKTEEEKAQEQEYENSICKKCYHHKNEGKRIGCCYLKNKPEGILSEDHKSCKYFEMSRYYKNKEEAERQAQMRTDMFTFAGITPKYKIGDEVYYVEWSMYSYITIASNVRDIKIYEYTDNNTHQQIKRYEYLIKGKNASFREDELYANEADALKVCAERLVKRFKDEANNILRRANVLGLDPNTLMPALGMSTDNDNN